MFQPKFPLKFSDIDGAYESIKDIKQNIKQNVLFLLKTSPGEWPGHPEIGVGLKHFLFENYPSRELMSINKRIKDQFSVTRISKILNNFLDKTSLVGSHKS